MFSYVLAVQNGGVPVARDFNKDKSIIGRCPAIRCRGCT